MQTLIIDAKPGLTSDGADPKTLSMGAWMAGEGSERAMAGATSAPTVDVETSGDQGDAGNVTYTVVSSTLSGVPHSPPATPSGSGHDWNSSSHESSAPF